MKNERLLRLACGCVIALTALAAGYLAVRHLGAILFPFLFAFGVAFLLRPLILYVCRKSRASQPMVGILLFFLLVFVLLYAFVALAIYLGREASGALSALLEELNRDENVLSRFFGAVSSLQERFPFLQGAIFEGDMTLYDGIVRMARTLLTELSTKLTEGLTRVLGGLPRGVFAVTVSLLAMFYFFKDYNVITAALRDALPPAVRERLMGIKERLLDGMLRYARAYLLLLFLTFAELLAGLLVLGVDYAVLIALITAILDLLPVIGVGIVLIPWALGSFILGNSTLGVGLLVLYGVLYLVRQIIEPRIVSGMIGVHPLLTLIAVYAGYRLLGVAGMVLAPILAFLIKSVSHTEKAPLSE